MKLQDGNFAIQYTKAIKSFALDFPLDHKVYMCTKLGNGSKNRIS